MQIGDNAYAAKHYKSFYGFLRHSLQRAERAATHPGDAPQPFSVSGYLMPLFGDLLVEPPGTGGL